jgi:hypothetical protein
MICHSGLLGHHHGSYCLETSGYDEMQREYDRNNGQSAYNTLLHKHFRMEDPIKNCIITYDCTKIRKDLSSCSDSIILFALSGGFGLQTEHHFFASRNHCHLL